MAREFGHLALKRQGLAIMKSRACLFDLSRTKPQLLPLGESRVRVLPS